MGFVAGTDQSYAFSINASGQHDVVVADDALMVKAADAVQVLGRGTPGLLGIARRAGEAAIVIGEEAGQELIGGVEIGGASEAEFAGEAILQRAPGGEACLKRYCWGHG